VVSIVGYTNAGKSTLLNTLTGADVLAENKLFATLDTRSRRLRFPEERYEQNGKNLVLRTIWRFDGDTKMLAVTEQQKDGQWVEAWRVAYERE